jgi:hypothetical protein
MKMIKIMGLPSHKLVFFIYQFTCFGPWAIIRWFLWKCTNDGILHVNYSASVKHFC